MDPNETLRRIRYLTEKAMRMGLNTEEAYSLAELCMGLDSWLSKGGFLPQAWTKHRGPDGKQWTRVFREIREDPNDE